MEIDYNPEELFSDDPGRVPGGPLPEGKGDPAKYGPSDARFYAAPWLRGRSAPPREDSGFSFNFSGEPGRFPTREIDSETAASLGLMSLNPDDHPAGPWGDLKYKYAPGSGYEDDPLLNKMPNLQRALRSTAARTY